MGKQTVRALGVMSGTSLDGLDLAAVEFCRRGKTIDWQFIKTRTIAFDPSLVQRLAGAMTLSGLDLVRLDRDFGKFCGESVRMFLEEGNIEVDLIASHGHTVFHRPDERLTWQIGSGAEIAAITGLPVICDFRSADVALGGQGAPLVPVGDQLLFPQYDYCINLGGIANISMTSGGKRTAFDICPCNQVLNLLAAEAGKSFDEAGAMAASGNLIPELFGQLEALDYYRLQPPKSLGREWTDQHVLPLINASTAPLEDRLNTFNRHIASRIAKVAGNGRALLTGGGAYNSYLLDLIRQEAPFQIETGNDELIDFKEALVFALLGTLKWWGEPNVYHSVTGALTDHCGGAEYRLELR